MNDVKQVLKQLGVGQQLVEELQDALCDQRTQYTKGELLADIQIAGRGMSFESCRKAFAQGKKNTAENVHRARNRVRRPEMAESLEDMEARYKQMEKRHRVFERYRRI